MTVNEKLLRKVVRAIENAPGKWKQSDWAKITDRAREQLVPVEVDAPEKWQMLPEGVTCGTSMCLAGQAVSQAGLPLLFWEGAKRTDYCLIPETGEHVEIRLQAQKLLGLSDRQARLVFHQNAAKPGVIDLDSPSTEGLSYLEDGDEDDIEVFKERITAWTGVTFLKETEPVLVSVLGQERLSLRKLRREGDDHYLAAVDEHGVITLTPAVLVPTPKEK